MKIGGDHGGSSFKMSYQVCNTDRPNSKNNTVVFSIFEAKDYTVNMKIGLCRFSAQIDHLQNASRRQKHVRVFIFGDYAFLCAIYALTGANGRHCCLYCTITKEEMQNTIAGRSCVSKRTLEAIADDLKGFREAGGNIKNAKNFNNVIDDVIFNVPIDQNAGR